MVAGGDDVDAQLEQFFRDLRSDAKTSGGILTVGDGEVHAVLLLQLGQAFMHDGASRAAENVTNEENAHVLQSLKSALNFDGTTGLTEGCSQCASSAERKKS